MPGTFATDVELHGQTAPEGNFMVPRKGSGNGTSASSRKIDHLLAVGWSARASSG